MTAYFERAWLDSCTATPEEADRFKSLGKSYTYNELSETFGEDGKRFKTVIYELNGHYHVERFEEVSGEAIW